MHNSYRLKPPAVVIENASCLACKAANLEHYPQDIACALTRKRCSHEKRPMTSYINAFARSTR